MAQRFGPYSFVVNTDKIDRKSAEEQGWDLFNDPKLAGRYGIQESDDWNVFDIFLIAGIDPFKEHSEDEMNKFKETAVRVFKGAKMVAFYKEALYKIEKIREDTTYYDLMGANDYVEEFQKAMFLPHTDIEIFNRSVSLA